MSKRDKLGELITGNKENAEKLSAADVKVASDKDKIEKKISKLILKNKQNSKELIAAYKIITIQKKAIKKQTEKLISADKEKEKRSADLISAKKELAHKAELIILNKKLLAANKQEKLAKEKYFELFNFAPTCYFTFSRDGKIIDSNLFASQILGKEHAFLKDHWFGNFVSEDTKPIFNNFLKQVFKSKTKQICEVTLLSDCELPIFIYLIGIVTKNEEQCLVSLDDITERKQFVKALQESKEKFHSYIEHSPVGIFIIDKTGKYFDCNPSAYQMIGYTREELLSMSIIDLLPVQEIEKGLQNFQKLAENGFNKFEINLLRKDKSTVYVILEAVQLPENNMFMAFCTNIEKIKNAEFELRKRFDEIETINKELGVTNVELIKAKGHAEESDLLKRAFLNNISHEIRTPFNGILGFLSLLQFEDVTIEERNEYTGIINQSADRLMNTINDIVEISQIQSGQIQISISETNLKRLAGDLCHRFEPEIERKQLKFGFSIDLPDTLNIVATDEPKLKSILSNLIGNAIKFTKSGSVKCSVRAHEDDIEFSVKDTGIGISENKQTEIFKMFMQADPSNCRKFEGSGLGLSITKVYVEMLGGKIWVESEEGVGSTFYFTLPCNAEHEEKNIVGNSVPAHEEKYQINPEISGLKILIAEDDEISEMLITINVGEFSKEILKARNGVEAIEFCRSNPDTDLILMDIQMPVMNGYEATRQIRQFNKDVVIIAQTAFGLSGDREKAIEAGCNDYIAKPIKKVELLSLIQKYFRK